MGPEPPPVAGAKWVGLSRGQWALVDDVDYDAVSAHLWSFSRPLRRGPQFSGYAVRTPKQGHTQFLHRFIWERMGVSEPGADVDHVNGDGLDNRRSNLRVASRSMNNANMRLRCDSQSGFKGVSRRRYAWVAQIKAQGSVKYIGSFRTARDAARAYDAAALKFFGPFAKTNASLGLLDEA